MDLFNRIPNKPVFLFLTTVLFIGSGCSTIEQKKAKEFDPSQVNNMLFDFDHNPTFLKSTLPKLEISTQVSTNLAEWGYKIKADKSTEHSHILSIEIGDITHAATPAGFSFSIGNSTPRAIDFQKADIIPMNCYLKAKNQSEKSAELDATILANDYLPFLNQTKTDKELVTILVNDISTICFNLLNNLKIESLPHNKSPFSKKTGWFPDIRVEIVNDAETENSDQPTTTIEGKKTKKASRKRMIIHNQGSPVTIKFGHERK